MNYEDIVFSKIKGHLPDAFSISTNFDIISRLRPDGILYYKQIPIAILEIKNRLDKRSIEFASHQMIEYAKTYDVRIMVVCSETHACILSESNDFRPNALLMELEFFVNSVLLPAVKEEKVDEATANEFKRIVKEQVSNIKISNPHFASYIESLTLADVENSLRSTCDNYIFMTDSFEDKFFKKLIGEFNEDILCRYTSLSSTIRILKDKKASTCGIACMNDKSECYYVDQYLSGKQSERLLTKMSEVEVKEVNSCFIMSCSDIKKHDKLTMWRMYGCDATGTCFTYKKNDILRDNPKFYLAPVSYAKENGNHPELDFIKKLCECKISGKKLIFQNLNLWKHFFKPFDYADECEIRLLYKDVDASKYKWITTGNGILSPIIEFCIENGKNEFPLTLEKIMLGPKCAEKHTNAAQLKYFCKLQNIERTKNEIDIAISSIDNYR